MAKPRWKTANIELQYSVGSIPTDSFEQLHFHVMKQH